jgi:hypothetical protein
MAVLTLLEFLGMTREQYEQIGASLSESPPESILYHGCGPASEGWRIADVWESREAFDGFGDGTYLPAVRRTGGPNLSRREMVGAHHAGVVEQP